MNCPNCNKEVSPDWKLCPFCGFEPKKCSNPGCQPRWLPKEARFCPECGKPLDGNGEVITPPSPPKVPMERMLLSVHKVKKEHTSYNIGDDFVFEVKGVEFKMIFVQGGTFQMGATPEQGDDTQDLAKPVHKVTLDDFYLGEIPVTQALWMAVMENANNPSRFKGDDLPVESLSWYDCISFCKTLNGLLSSELPSNFRFVLPTEAQWEYAARGGVYHDRYKYSGSNLIEEVAWYIDNSDFKTHPVKEKKPNSLGLYDMSGNVYEMCADCGGSYSRHSQTNPKGPSVGIDRMIRGGCWIFSEESCRVSNRFMTFPHENLDTCGFRLALVHE